MWADNLTTTAWIYLPVNSWLAYMAALKYNGTELHVFLLIDLIRDDFLFHMAEQVVKANIKHYKAGTIAVHYTFYIHTAINF